ncbi:hypothetical protein ACQKMD_01380 [Viridibacillus sp. NPDC096237]|uniref:hypothetical protein n=1 Tax=Viridibacillus sp. NPDC096237 TaxID=3390721 RepID=UPI003D014F42
MPVENQMVIGDNTNYQFNAFVAVPTLDEPICECDCCKESVYEGSGVLYQGDVFCGSSCLGDFLIKTGAAEEI